MVNMPHDQICIKLKLCFKSVEGTECRCVWWAKGGKITNMCMHMSKVIF